MLIIYLYQVYKLCRIILSYGGWGQGPGVTWGQIMANESECLVGRGCRDGHFAEKFVKNIVPSSIFLRRKSVKNAKW